MKGIRKLFNLAIPLWRVVVVLYICSLFHSVATALSAATLGQIMKADLATAHGLSFSGIAGVIFAQYPTVYLTAAAIICLFLIRGFFGYFQNYLSRYMSQKIIMDLRIRLYTKLHMMSIGYYDRNRSGQVISKVINDANHLQSQLGGGLFQILIQPVSILVLLAYAAVINWRVVVILLLVLPLAGLFIRNFSIRMKKIGRRVQIKAGDVLQVLVETISAIRVVKAFNAEEREIERFTEENRESFDVTMKGAKLTSFFSPVIEFLAAVFIAGVLVYVGFELLRGTLTQQDIGTILFVFAQVSEQIRQISTTFSGIPHTMAALERVYSILDEEPEIKEMAHARELPQLQGEIVFAGVSFAYHEGVPVLKDIDLRINPGEMVALVGPSGGGKTTLVNLIPRFYDPTTGVIRVDGYDLKEVTFRSLRRQIGVVAQDTILFAGTIASNIAYGNPEASLEEIMEAAKVANAHEFIEKLPDGYETVVGERGISLSGGQRQRISIARAVLLDPRILILDEATSALDSESEKLVQEALSRLMKNRTSVVIAHRLSTVRQADRLVAIRQGRIVQMGTHEELLNQPGLYQSLYRRQFSEI